MKLILFSMFLMCAYYSGVKVSISGFSGQIAEFIIDNASLIDAAKVRISVECFKDLIFEGIRKNNPTYQFDSKLTKLVEGKAELSTVPDDDQEVTITLGKLQPRYKVFQKQVFSCVKINGFTFAMKDGEENLKALQEAELADLVNYEISMIYSDENPEFQFCAYFNNIKFNERITQVLRGIKDFIKLCQQGQYHRYRCVVLKAFDLAGIEYKKESSDYEISGEDEEIIKRLLLKEGLI